MELLVYAFFDRFLMNFGIFDPITPFLARGGVKIPKLPEVLAKNSLIFPLLFWPFWRFPGVPPGKPPKWPQKGGKNMTNSRKMAHFYDFWPKMGHFDPFLTPPKAFWGGVIGAHFNPILSCIAVHFGSKWPKIKGFLGIFNPILSCFDPIIPFKIG